MSDKEKIDEDVEAELCFYPFDPSLGKVFLDDDNEVLDGWYFRFVKKATKEPVCGLYGPYSDQEEAHVACIHEWENNDFHV